MRLCVFVCVLCLCVVCVCCVCVVCVLCVCCECCVCCVYVCSLYVVCVMDAFHSLPFIYYIHVVLICFIDVWMYSFCVCVCVCVFVCTCVCMCVCVCVHVLEHSGTRHMALPYWYGLLAAALFLPGKYMICRNW